MKQFKPVIAAMAGVCLLATSCVDDNYDLSDIDTTVRIDVNDLVIPINIDDVTLSSIFNLKDGGNVQVIDGVYTVVKDGDFRSSAVRINDFTMPAQPKLSSQQAITFVPASGELLGSFPLRALAGRFSFETSDVTSDILEFRRVNGPLTFYIDFLVQPMGGFDRYVSAIEYHDLVIQLPKGMSVTDAAGGSYDPATGLLSLPPVRVNGGVAPLSLAIKVDGVDFHNLGGIYDYNRHYVKVEGDLYVTQGNIVIRRSDYSSASVMPATLGLQIDYSTSAFHITSFSGRIKYSVKNLNVPDVDLDMLPDIIDQPGTDVRLANPQLYLSVVNPLQSYRLEARTGLTISAYHHNSLTGSYSLDNPYFTIGNAASTSDRFNYCLSPEAPASFYPGYDNAVHVGYRSLSDVLSGDGLPERLSVHLDNPEIPAQDVDNLALGVDLGTVNGTYAFVAPIALLPGSSIVYSDVLDGWGGDLDDLTVNRLSITATVTSSLPVSIHLSGYPLDGDGNRIPGVEIHGADVAVSSQPQQIEIVINGPFNGLDGVHFEAVAVSANADPLRPDMTIKLADVRPCVSGFYQSTDDDDDDDDYDYDYYRN